MARTTHFEVESQCPYVLINGKLTIEKDQGFKQEFHQFAATVSVHCPECYLRDGVFNGLDRYQDRAKRDASDRATTYVNAHCPLLH